MINLEEMIKFVKDHQPNRPPISKNTLRQYMSGLTKLHRFITGRDDITTMDWIYQTDKVLEYMEKNPSNDKPRSPATKRNNLSYVITIFKALKDDKNVEYYNKLYIDQYNIVNKIVKSNESSSQKQSEKIISMEEYNNMLDRFKKDGLETDYMIFKLLKTFGMRNEVSTLVLIDLKSYNKLKKQNKLDKNYLVLGKTKMMISRSDYKTFKTYGLKENIINDKVLKKELLNYISEIKDGEQVFKSTDGKPYTNQALSSRLTFISEKYIGIALSSSSIFKIVLSNFKGNMKQTKDFIIMKSNQRGTDPTTILQNYIYNLKVDDK